jgi:c(7)-type cytochrome triheme protein
MKTTAYTTRLLKCGTVLVSCFAAVAVWAVYPSEASIAETDREGGSIAARAPAAQEFSHFDHRGAQHARMPCLLCHIRSQGVTTPRMPGHTPCAGCHVQQMSDDQSAICTICHTATGVKPFPPLRSFNVMFNHATHVRQTACATCHKPSRGGAALSVPSRAAAHATCFTCHGPRTEIGERNIGSCSTCHQPGRPVRNSDASRAFAVNFSHREHLSGRNMNCATCHTVQRGSAHGRQVTAPLLSMHFAPAGHMSCGACHNNKRAFGPPDFADCKRCHEGKSFKF